MLKIIFHDHISTTMSARKSRKNWNYCIITRSLICLNVSAITFLRAAIQGYKIKGITFRSYFHLLELKSNHLFYFQRSLQANFIECRARGISGSKQSVTRWHCFIGSHLFYEWWEPHGLRSQWIGLRLGANQSSRRWNRQRLSIWIKESEILINGLDERQQGLLLFRKFNQNSMNE